MVNIFCLQDEVNRHVSVFMEFVACTSEKIGAGQAEIQTARVGALAVPNSYHNSYPHMVPGEVQPQWLQHSTCC